MQILVYLANARPARPAQLDPVPRKQNKINQNQNDNKKSHKQKTKQAITTKQNSKQTKETEYWDKYLAKY